MHAIFSGLLTRAVVKKVELPMKDIYMSLLLRLNEDFDDDFLRDAI